MKVGILLSGGQDSIALAYWKKPSVAFTVDYGQRAALAEIKAAQAFCKLENIHHEIIEIGSTDIYSGEMFGRPALEEAPYPEWTPFRNQLLVTLAAAKAVQIGLSKLLIGQVAEDMGHSDGTIEFTRQLSSLLRMQEGGIELDAPASSLSTLQLIRESAIPSSILMLAHSCHRSQFPCGECRGCNKNLAVLDQLDLIE